MSERDDNDAHSLSKFCVPRGYAHYLNMGVLCRGGIKIFKALARLASNSKFLLAKSEKNLAKIMSLLSICTVCTLSVLGLLEKYVCVS
jgi:hypothetical protein